jgi:transposase InsO family protein
MKGVWQREYVNYTEAEIDITAYIVTFYNAKRLYPTLDNLPPVIFERKMAEKNLW